MIIGNNHDNEDVIKVKVESHNSNSSFFLYNEFPADLGNGATITN